MPEQNLNSDALEAAGGALWGRMSDPLERKVYAFADAPTMMAYTNHARAVVTAYLSALPAQPELQENSKPNQNLELQPDTVSSVEELDALPVGTVVYAANHIGPAERFDVGWMGCGNSAAWSSELLARDGLPATMIYRPVEG